MSSHYAETETLPQDLVKTARPPLERAAIRVVVAESSRDIRDFLTTTLAADARIELLAACSNCGELQTALETEPTDVLVTDIRMPPAEGDEGIRIARRLRQTHPQIGVVLLSQYAEPAYVLSVLESGSARAYLLKERLSEKSELIDAIETVARGGIVVDPEIVDSLIETRARVARSPLPRLSRGERELLALIVEGNDNATIARSLATPEPIVEARASAISQKLGLPRSDDISGRVQGALAYLAEEGG
jgi:DNA-binding NarL/FixJ family response regulator